VISLVGIASGVVVLFGFLTAKRMDRWTALFLWTTLATSVTGFFFPFVQLLPAHIVGVISVVALALVFYARYRRSLTGAWRLISVIGSVLALYLNVLVLVVQLFRRIPALHALAPTESEPPFLVAQLVVLTLFVALGAVAAVRFRGDSFAQKFVRAR
jgi:hypothetical protein